MANSPSSPSPPVTRPLIVPPPHHPASLPPLLPLPSLLPSQKGLLNRIDQPLPALQPTRDFFVEIAENDFLIEPLHHAAHLFMSPPNRTGMHVWVSQDPDLIHQDHAMIYRLRLQSEARQASLQMCPPIEGRRNIVVPWRFSRKPVVLDPVSFFCPNVMKIMCWNVRGSGEDDFEPEARRLIDSFRPHMFVALDTRLNGDAALAVIRRLSYSSHQVIPSIGKCGGIWVLWNGYQVDVQRAGYCDGVFTAQLTLRRNRRNPFAFSAASNYPQPSIQDQNMQGMWRKSTANAGYNKDDQSYGRWYQLSEEQRSKGWVEEHRKRANGNRFVTNYRHILTNEKFKSLNGVYDFIKFGISPRSPRDRTKQDNANNIRGLMHLQKKAIRRYNILNKYISSKETSKSDQECTLEHYQGDANTSSGLPEQICEGNTQVEGEGNSQVKGETCTSEVGIPNDHKATITDEYIQLIDFNLC